MSKTFELGFAIIGLTLAIMVFIAIPTIRENPDQGVNIMVDIMRWFADALASLVTGEVNRVVGPILLIASAPVAVIVLWFLWQGFLGGN